MANIVFTVNEMICESPTITNSSYTGDRYKFSLDWTSNADYYLGINAGATFTLYVDITDEFGGSVYGFAIGNISANATGYIVDILDYLPSHSGKDTVTFTLKLETYTCNSEDSVVFLGYTYDI